MSFGLMSFGLMLFGLMSFGLMSFVLLFVYSFNSSFCTKKLFYVFLISNKITLTSLKVKTNNGTVYQMHSASDFL